MGDVARMVLDGHAQVWADGDRALLITEIHEYPRARILHFWIAAGELERVVRLSRRAIEWGRSRGCVRASLAGRHGWTRVLAREGWTPILTVMGREI